MTKYHAIIRHNSRPLDPRPTELEPRLAKITGMRAVLFDIYGTMLVSASGEVGTALSNGQSAALSGACSAIGLSLEKDPDEVVSQLHATIKRHHQRANLEKIEYPEVDIVEVWKELLDQGRAGSGFQRLSHDKICELAVEYESRVNPVWPMPGLETCLKRLSAAGLTLGIVSNAQFFTPPLFPALVGASLDEIGFSRSLQLLSFEHRQAKPGLFLYKLARQSLQSSGIEPDEVIYIGNDMLNDIMPSQQVGFRTALFAGDARSLRIREDDERTRDTQPDLVITELSQLIDCVVMS